MKNKFLEKVIEEKVKIYSVVCNCCGKKIEFPDGYDNTEITDITISFGYGSRFDLTTWEMDVCDDCIEKWVKTFKLPIEIHEDLI